MQLDMEGSPDEQDYSKTNEREMKETKSGSSTKFVKLWSEEDEITLLSGYYEYRENKGKYDGSGKIGFYEFIKHRLIRSSANRSQVSDKICRLRKKYEKHTSKLGSKRLNVVDPHLQKLFELSAKIWGIEFDAKDVYSNNNIIIHENMSCPLLSSTVVKSDLSNKLLDEEFLGFLYHEGVDIDLLDGETITDLKRKFGEVELCRSRFEYKDAKLTTKLQKLKYDHYKEAWEKFFHLK